MTTSRKRAQEDHLPAAEEDQATRFVGDDGRDDGRDGGWDAVWDDDEAAAYRLRPEWLHPDCSSVCLALELGTCCEYPDNPLVRVAVDLARSVDALLRRPDGDCASTGAELARALRFVPGLLAQIHAILPRLNRTAVAQLLCPVGRLVSALEQVCGGGRPWACGSQATPERRAEFEPLIELAADCSAAVRAALGWQSRPWQGSRVRRGAGPGYGAARH